MSKIFKLFSVIAFICITFLATAQPYDIVGRVVDGTTDPDWYDLVGVTVRIKGTDISSTTNTQGLYIITASANDTLVFSYPGYETQEIPVNGRSMIHVYLMPSQGDFFSLVNKETDYLYIRENKKHHR